MELTSSNKFCYSKALVKDIKEYLPGVLLEMKRERINVLYLMEITLNGIRTSYIKLVKI